MSRIVESLRHTFCHAVYRYDDLQEKDFLERILSDLERQLGDRVGQYEFVLYSSADDTALPQELVSAGWRKRVLIYISDEMSSVPRHLCDKFFAIFKCYLPSDRGLPNNLFPLPLGCTAGFADLPIRPPAERSVSVFFSGNLNANRVPLYRELTWLRYLPCRARLAQRLMHRMGWLPRDCSRVFPASYIRFTDGFSAGCPARTTAARFSTPKSPSVLAVLPAARAFGITRPCGRLRRHLRALVGPRFYPDRPSLSWTIGATFDAWCETSCASRSDWKTLHRQTRNWWQDMCCEEAMARFMKEKLDLLENAHSQRSEL